MTVDELVTILGEVDGDLQVVVNTDIRALESQSLDHLLNSVVQRPGGRLLLTDAQSDVLGELVYMDTGYDYSTKTKTEPGKEPGPGPRPEPWPGAWAALKLGLETGTTEEVQL